MAVLEHIRFPFIMMREAYRLLKPDGKFIGTVAFLELFHNSSFYHLRTFGLITRCKMADLKFTHIAPNETWSALIASGHGAFSTNASTSFKANRDGCADRASNMVENRWHVFTRNLGQHAYDLHWRIIHVYRLKAAAAGVGGF